MEYVVVDARGLPVGAGEEAVIFPRAGLAPVPAPTPTPTPTLPPPPRLLIVQ